MITAEIKYKKTDNEWVPEIPQHWDFRRLKNFAEIGSGQDQKGIENDNGKYSIYGTGGLMGKTNEFLYEGPSVILGRKGTIDNPFYVTEPFWTVDTAYYTKIKGNVDPRFFFYCCLTIQFDYYKYGSAVPSMSQRDLNQIRLPYPPLEEQKVIADYLDTQSAKITRFIQTKQRFIELLKEQRQSIITNAVTKGIDDGVKMKETGVNWMPEVPDHWQIRRLKTIVSGATNGVWGSEPKNNDEDIVCIRVADIDTINYGIDTSNLTRRSISINDQQGRLLSFGDLIIEKSGGGEISPVGRVVIFNQEIKAVTSNFMGRLNINHNVNNEFLYYLFTTLYAIRINIPSIKATTGIQNLDLYSYLQNRVPIPPLQEQKHIVEHIKTETRTLDIAISKAEREIELIKEYREAMIAEAVTGKMKL